MREHGLAQRRTLLQVVDHLGRQVPVLVLEHDVALAVQGRGEQRGARVVERRVRALEALLAQLLEAKGLEPGQHMGVGALVVGVRNARVAGQRDVDDLQELVLVDGLDPFAQQQGFYLRVLVQVPDFRDHAEPDGGRGEVQTTPVACENVKEEICGAVVGFRGRADRSGDGTGH